MLVYLALVELEPFIQKGTNMIPDVQMSGSEVARHLNITRQTVSTTTKRAVEKMYYRVLELRLADNPFDAMMVLMSMCNVTDGPMEDVSKFLDLFPDDIRLAVQKHSPKKKESCINIP